MGIAQPALHWLAAQGMNSVLDGGTVSVGKEIVLRETWPLHVGPPIDFTIHRSFGHPMNTLLRALGILHWSGATAHLEAEQMFGNESRSKFNWVAGVKGGVGQSSYVFRDDRGFGSDRLTVSTQSWSLVSSSAAANASVNPFGMATPAPMGSGLEIGLGHRQVTLHAQAVKDPTIRLKLLLPWTHPDELDSLVLEALEASEVANLQPAHDFLREAYLPPRPPKRWELYMEESELILDAGQSVPVHIDATLMGPGAAVVAVRSELAGDSREFVVSDPIVLTTYRSNGPP